MNKSTSLIASIVAVALSFVTHANAQDRNNELLARDPKGDLIVRDDRAGFGEQRQWVFSSESTVQFSRRTFSGQSGATTSLTIGPAVDYFVLRNFSVGGIFLVNYSKTGDDHGTRVTLGPRVGYNVELSRLLSVWPKLGFSYDHAKQVNKVDVPNVGTVSSTAKTNAIALNLYAPLMIHPAKHFVAGFGPYLDTDLSGSTRATEWGFKLTLGGWMNSGRDRNE